jgi:raffinose/stachyose/melibiose transport system permease protein
MAVVNWRSLGDSSNNDNYNDSERDRRRRTRSKYLAVLIFLAPGMFFFFAFLLFPVSNSFYYSTFKWNGLGPPTDYVGFKNYDFLLGQKAFRMSIENSFTIVILSLTVQLPMAMTLALMVGRGKLPGRAIFRVILFIPYVFSEILTAYIWMYIFHPRDGLVNTLYHTVTSSTDNLALLADKDIALYAVFFVITWKFFGLHMILYMAALQGVPKDLEDAARIDGASEMQVIRKVTLPMMGPTIRLTIFLSVLGSFQQFVLIWILTTGGPANATHVLATYLYKYGIISWRLGLGSAIAVMLFVITFSFSLIYQRLVMRRDYHAQAM